MKPRLMTAITLFSILASASILQASGIDSNSDVFIIPMEYHNV